MIAVACGILLVVGFLTPVAGSVIGLGIACVLLTWMPSSQPNRFETALPAIFVGIMSVAIVLLGPGAFSVDARLFGRREIIIPPVSRKPRQ
jgi:uncharacterized membrane protein YphA (DoxX/SURF4 family)